MSTSTMTPPRKPGRPTVRTNTGPGYKLAEWLDRVWDGRARLTNFEASKLFGVSHNMISMWRKGRARVHIGHLVPMSRLLKADLAFLLRLWLDQYLGVEPDHMREIERVFDRLPTEAESKLIDAIRATRSDDHFTAAEIEAVTRLLRPATRT